MNIAQAQLTEMCRKFRQAVIDDGPTRLALGQSLSEVLVKPWLEDSVGKQIILVPSGELC